MHLSTPPVQRTQLVSMAAITLLGMPLVGWVIARFNEDIDLMVRWSGPQPVVVQLAFGLPAGLAAAFGARFMVSRKFMDGVRLRYARMFRGLQLNWSEIVFISMCAGVGEELLFRGVLQPIFGIFLTAVVFVVIHGYLNPRDWRISVYGIYMTAVIVGLGYMTESIGVWSAVFAHFIIDVVLLADLIERPKRAINGEGVNDLSDEP